MCEEDMEAFVAYFKALLRHMPGVTKENRELQRHTTHPPTKNRTRDFQNIEQKL
jgi:hypothetical protein